MNAEINVSLSSEEIYNLSEFAKVVYTAIITKQEQENLPKIHKLDLILKHITNKENDNHLTKLLLTCIKVNQLKRKYNTQNIEHIFREENDFTIIDSISESLIKKYRCRILSAETNTKTIYEIYRISKTNNKIYKVGRNIFAGGELYENKEFVNTLMYDATINDILDFLMANSSIFNMIDFYGVVPFTNLKYYDETKINNVKFITNFIKQPLLNKYEFAGYPRYGYNNEISFNKITKIEELKYETSYKRNEFCRNNCPNIYNFLNSFNNNDIYKSLYQLINYEYRSKQVLKINDSHNNFCKILYAISNIMNNESWITFHDKIDSKTIYENINNNNIYTLFDDINAENFSKLNQRALSHNFKKKTNSIVIYNGVNKIKNCLYSNMDVEIDCNIIEREIENFMRVCNNFIQEENAKLDEVDILNNFINSYNFVGKTLISKDEFDLNIQEFIEVYNTKFKFKKDKLTISKVKVLLKERYNYKKTTIRINDKHKSMYKFN